MSLSFILYIIATGVSFIFSILGVIFSSLGKRGWIIPTILFIIAFIILLIIVIKTIYKIKTDPAKRARFIESSHDDKYAQFESVDITNESKENVYTEEDIESFVLLQADSKIFDKKFDTKAVGYWADALKRFCRNKASLVCFVVLAIIVLLSIFGTVISPYSSTQPVNSRFGYLAPKWPLLEKLGILDGTTVANDIQLNTIVFLDENEKENFKYKDLLSSLDANWYTPQDYDLEKVSISQQYDSRFIVKMEEPILVRKYEQKKDPNGTGWLLDENGNVVYEEKCYYTVTITYDKYAFLMEPYEAKNVASEGFVKYFNSLLDKNSEQQITIDDVKEILENTIKTSKVPLVDPVTEKKTTYYLLNEDGSKTYIHVGTYHAELADIVNELLAERYGVESADEIPVRLTAVQKTNTSYNYKAVIDPVLTGEITENTYFIFGTDAIGRDMWSRIWGGLGLSMLIGLAVGVFSIVFGVCWGAISGYYGGIVDIAMERFTDILVNVPSLIILTLLNLYLGTRGNASILVFVLALIMTSWVGISSSTRVQFYRYKRREYILASRTMGAKDGRLIFKHILPNGIGPLVNIAVSIIPASMRFETSMSYLGIASMSENSIGQIISSASDLVTSPYAYLLVIPSIIFSIIMVSFSIMGLGLRDALNPSLRGS